MPTPGRGAAGAGASPAGSSGGHQRRGESTTAACSGRDAAAIAEEIRRTVELLHDPGDVVELRGLRAGRAGTVSGYYDDPAALARDAERWDGRATGLYVTLQAIQPALLARATNRAVERARTTTADTDVARYRWLLVDLDAVRPAGVSSSDAEHDAALTLARDVAAWLVDELGVSPSSIIVADSGNGAHVLVRIDLPADAESRRLIGRCLAALDLQCSTGAVLVDTSTSNPSRICRLYGTLARKGDATPDRLHRRSRILRAPEPAEIAQRDLLERLAAMAPAEPEDEAPRGRQRLDVAAWLERHAIPVARSRPYEGGTLYVLDSCPIDETHERDQRATYVIQHRSGAISAGCHHARCTWGWRELRVRYEPAPPGPDDEAPGDDRETVPITTDEADVADQALEALARDPGVYTRGHPAHLVRVVRPRRATDVTGGAPVVVELSTAALRERLTRHVRFVRRGRDSMMHLAHPPDWLVAALAARAEYPDLRDLVGVVTTPTLRRDGTILDVPGYDDASGLLYVPTGEIPTVPTHPTLTEAQLERDELLEVVCDFPFASPAHCSAWLAMVLTLVARHAIAGNVPLFDIDANVRGAGKGLLADAAAVIGTGHPLPRKPQPSGDEEMRKYILAVALAGTPIVLLDNCTGKVSYRSLDAALTCEGRWEDRVLGKSESRTLPLRTVWSLTGNNAALGHDLVRRTLPIRLASELENPEDRADVKHRDLLGWLRRERPRLVCAVLTLLRAYYVAGCPERDLVPWGSYAAWSRLIRQSVVWLGLPDPIEARHELRERADVDREAIVVVYDTLERLGGATAAGLRIAAETHPDLRAALIELAGGDDELPTARRIAAVLRGLRGRVMGDRRLEARIAHGGALRWLVTSPRRGANSHRSHHSHHGEAGDCGDGGDSAEPAGVDL